MSFHGIFGFRLLTTFALIAFCSEAKMPDMINNMVKKLRRQATQCEIQGYNIFDEPLCYTTSKTIDRQVVVANKSADFVIVIDPNVDKYALLDGNTGKGVVIDTNYDLVYEIEKGPWESTEVGTFAVDCNIGQLAENNNVSPIQSEDVQPGTSTFEYISNFLKHFGEELKDVVVSAGRNLIETIKEKIHFIINPLKSILSPIINFATDGWVVIKSGILALLNVFKWMGQFVTYITGGITTLITAAVQFPLQIIVTAINGVKAFFYLLKELVSKFDFTTLLKEFIGHTCKLANFISGLGGEIVKGITGTFKIVGKIVDFVQDLVDKPIRDDAAITADIAVIVDLILGYFQYGIPQKAEICEVVDEFLLLIEEQDQIYKNRPGLKPLEDFLIASKGGTSTSLTVAGIDVAALFETLIDRTSENGIEMAVEILEDIKTVIPYNITVPALLLGTLKQVNSKDGLDEIKKILPDLDVEKLTANRAYPVANRKKLSTSELVKLYPVANRVYEMIEEALRKHGGLKLNVLLDIDEININVELRSGLLSHGSV